MFEVDLLLLVGPCLLKLQDRGRFHSAFQKLSALLCSSSAHAQNSANIPWGKLATYMELLKFHSVTTTSPISLSSSRVPLNWPRLILNSCCKLANALRKENSQLSQKPISPRSGIPVHLILLFSTILQCFLQSSDFFQVLHQQHCTAIIYYVPPGI